MRRVALLATLITFVLPASAVANDQCFFNDSTPAASEFRPMGIYCLATYHWWWYGLPQSTLQLDHWINYTASLWRMHAGLWPWVLVDWDQAEGGYFPHAAGYRVTIFQ